MARDGGAPILRDAPDATPHISPELTLPFRQSCVMKELGGESSSKSFFFLFLGSAVPVQREATKDAEPGLRGDLSLLAR